MKKFIVNYLFLFSVTIAFTQEPSEQFYKNSIGLQIGYNQGYLKDINFSPLNYKENGALYNLNYTNHHAKGKGIIKVDINYSPSNLKTKASKFLSSSLTMANIEFSYLRKVTQKEKLSFYLGGQYSSYIQIVDWQDYESFSFLASHGIGINGLLSYQFNYKHQLTTSLFIPVFQFLARPPYNGIDEEIIENQDYIAKIIFSGKPTSFNQYLVLDWKINYLFTLSKRFDLSAKYLLRYQKVAEINKVIHLQNQFIIGFNVKF